MMIIIIIITWPYISLHSQKTDSLFQFQYSSFRIPSQHNCREKDLFNLGVFLVLSSGTTAWWLVLRRLHLITRLCVFLPFCLSFLHSRLNPVTYLLQERHFAATKYHKTWRQQTEIAVCFNSLAAAPIKENNIQNRFSETSSLFGLRMLKQNRLCRKTLNNQPKRNFLARLTENLCQTVQMG